MKMIGSSLLNEHLVSPIVLSIEYTRVLNTI